MHMTNKLFTLFLLALLLTGGKALADTPLQADTPPQLVVMVNIDQLRSDCLQRFAPHFRDRGFRRLMDRGQVFQHADYPFRPLDRASAIAAVASGTTPYYNSIVGQRWLSRETLRPVACTDDDRHAGLGTTAKASPAAMAVSTLTDELKVATEGLAKVFAIAAQCDAAILSGGHAADGAFWIDDATGQWCSSQYYGKKLPQWLRDHNKTQAPALKAEGTDPQRHTLYKQGWHANADVTNLAQQCIVSNALGTDETPDLLCLTYQAAGATAVKSQADLQETYIRLDHELGRLIDHAERWVGAGKVLFVVTGTGYSYEEEPDYEKYRIPSGTFYIDRTAGLLNMYLGAVWGQEKYVEATYGNQIFFNRKLLEAKKISLTEATDKAKELVVMMSGVKQVFTPLQLLASHDAYVQTMRNGFNAGRCGDLLIEVAPGWRVLNEDGSPTGLPTAADAQFPIVFYGAGLHAGVNTHPASALAIAPTLSHLLHIRKPNACTAAPLF